MTSFSINLILNSFYNILSDKKVSLFNLLFQIQSEGLKSAATSQHLGKCAAVPIFCTFPAVQNYLLLSDLTIKTTSYSHQTSPLITYKNYYIYTHYVVK